MRRKLGQAVQAVGGLLPLLLAGASDMGHIGAGQLAAGVCAAAALLLLGRLLTRKKRSRHRSACSVSLKKSLRRSAFHSAALCPPEDLLLQLRRNSP